MKPDNETPSVRNRPEISLGRLSVRDLQVLNERGTPLVIAEAIDVDSGSTVGIKGASGAGKSTLLFALAGLQDNCNGIVRWGETDLLNSAAADRAAFRRDHLGLVFQDFLLFDELGALPNAAIQSLFRPKPVRNRILSAAKESLSQLGIGQATKSVATHSGGERQRVSVARALAHDPSIILADEPTANLDRVAADALANDLIAQARDRGRTLIVVSHDPAVLGQMDQIITVKDGVVL